MSIIKVCSDFRLNLLAARGLNEIILPDRASVIIIASGTVSKIVLYHFWDIVVFVNCFFIRFTVSWFKMKKITGSIIIIRIVSAGSNCSVHRKC